MKLKKWVTVLVATLLIVGALPVAAGAASETAVLTEVSVNGSSVTKIPAPNARALRDAAEDANATYQFWAFNAAENASISKGADYHFYLAGTLASSAIKLTFAGDAMPVDVIVEGDSKLDDGATIDPATKTVSIPGAALTADTVFTVEFDDASSTAFLPCEIAPELSVDYALTNIDKGSSPVTVNALGAFTATLTAAQGYTLPMAVDVAAGTSPRPMSR